MYRAITRPSYSYSLLGRVLINDTLLMWNGSGYVGEQSGRQISFTGRGESYDSNDLKNFPKWKPYVSDSSNL